MLKGFKEFVIKGNAVELAVGVVIGASFSGVVNALVKDIITPLISAIGGKPDFSSFALTINQNTFLVGDFLNALLALLINATVIYFFVVLPMNHLLQAFKRDQPADITEKKCPECLSLIPLEAKRCKFCTSPQIKSEKRW